MKWVKPTNTIFHDSVGWLGALIRTGMARVDGQDKLMYRLGTQLKWLGWLGG